MSRYRLVPTPAQETALLGHCGHARYVWNLGLEQRLMWRPGRPATPGYMAQAAQLTEARDRGVAVSVALSTGELLACPGLRATEQARLKRLQRQLARCRRGSKRRARVKVAIARLKAWEAYRRKDWVEKLSTDLARRFDVIGVEDLKITNMTRSARGTVEEPGRVERVNPAYTSQTCAECGHCASENRESQAAFRCVACGHTAHADVNAARNIAAGRTVTARRGTKLVSLKREPHLATSA